MYTTYVADPAVVDVPVEADVMIVDAVSVSLVAPKAWLAVMPPEARSAE